MYSYKRQQQSDRKENSLFMQSLFVPFQMSTDLSQTATAAQSAADLAEVIIIPAWQRWACTPNAV